MGDAIAGGRKIEQIAGAIDLLPTLTDMAGIPVIGDKPLDGVSLKPLLAGTAQDWPDRMIFSHWSGKVSVRTQRYRLDNTGQLFDMQADPGQQRGIAKEQPEVAARLSAAVAQWKEEMLPGLKGEDRPYPVGHAQFPTTQLPARDGVPHGNVKRSAGAPNCSFFTNWTGKDDSITWDIQVKTAGRYDVAIHYACPQADVGSTVEVSFNGSRIPGKVAEANDPPLLGAENDRVNRGSESYVKDFKPLALGNVELKPGRGLLTLRATSIPGKQVMEVRMVELTLRK